MSDLPLIDVSELRENPASTVSAESVLLGISIRKPKRDDWIRVHPGADYTVTAAVIEYEGSGERRLYFVPPSLRNVAEQAAGSAYRAVQIFTCINKWDVVFLWPAALPDERENAWHVTGLQAASAAQDTWVRVQANMRAGRYEIMKAKIDYGDPVWPEKSFSELINLAWPSEHIITSEDHEVLKELRGEA